MTSSFSYGFGTGHLGTLPFGTSFPIATPLSVLEVFAVRENLIRVVFNVPPRYTQLLNPNDASDSRRYAITPITGTIGRDGLPTRPVSVIVVEQSEGYDGEVLDLILDRPMSPEPSRYQIVISDLVTAVDQTPMVSSAILEFVGLFKQVLPPIPELLINNRDIANPQSLTQIFDPLPVAEGDDLNALLGTFREDSQGDLAFDEGLAGYRKRVMRRLTTRKGRFAHLPNYGVSLITSVKQLSRAGVRESLAQDAEQQIRSEPETIAVSVQVVVDQSHPDIARYQVRARTNFGELPSFVVPLSFISAGL